MQQYRRLVDEILECGETREDRTGVGTKSIFGHQSRYDLVEGFPLLGLKKTNFHSIKGELLWFLKGNTNVKWLRENNIHIWDEWADEHGELGPVYGAQWRSWPDTSDGYSLDGEIDQIANVISSIKTSPNSRRHIVSAWNPSEIEYMALPPCHTMFQFYVRQDRYLDCHLYQRSGDVFLGVPFNIASYSLLTHMIAQVTGYEAGLFIHTLGDAHIYTNHLEQVDVMLNRHTPPQPKLILNPDIAHIDDFKMEDIAIEGYFSHPYIPAPVAV